MIRKIIIMGILLSVSTTAFALDLQREQLLNLYHGVKTNQTNTAQKWMHLSSSIAADYQGNEQEEITFEPLSESQTKIGVFISDSLHKTLTDNNDYELSHPAKFGQADDESYGLYIQKSF
jgi:hypothetical protein